MSRPPIHVAVASDNLDIERDCPCHKELCGFVNVFSASPDCEYHGPWKGAPQRRHILDLCPGDAVPSDPNNPVNPLP